MQPDVICNGVEVKEITLKADLVIQMDEETVWGIFLCRKFPQVCGLNSCSVGQNAWKTVEMLSFISALQQEYPNKVIKVSYIQAVSLRDTAEFLSEFEATPGDNIITFTSKDLFAKEKNQAIDLLSHILKTKKENSCNQCRYYKEFCQSKNSYSMMPLKRKEPYLLKEPTMNQKMVIEQINYAMRVCAGPGAGKTATLVARMEYMITKGISPGKILALTFTRKVAKEIEERILHDVKPNISTIHALAFQIIRQHECILGKKNLMNQTDCQKMLLQILNCSPIIKNADYQKLTGKQGLLASLLLDFSFIEKFGVAAYAEQFPKKDIATIVKIKKLYDQKVQAGGYIRFDEQISLAVWLLERLLETMIHERHIVTAKELWDYMTAVKFFGDETRIYMESDSVNAIHLLTAHDSKGKEYKAVIVCAVDDFELDNLQEDRRLLYVAVTRAKERLYLTEVCKGKSMFLKEMKPHIEVRGGLRYA